MTEKTRLFPRPTYIDDYLSSRFFQGGSRLVCGTSGLGGVWGEVNESESIDTLLYAFENGVSAIDTAPSYSQAETYVGKALKRWPGKRPFISTKVGRLKAKDAHTTLVDYSTEGLKRSFYHSLEVLGVDKVNILFLHEPHLVPLEGMDEILEVLLSFKKEGLTDMLGVGGNPPESFMPFVKKEYFDVVSGFLHLDACNLTALEGLIPDLKHKEIAYYAASALHFSLLGDGFEHLSRQPADQWISTKDQSAAIAVNAIANKYQIPLPSLAQRFLFSIAEADRVVTGASNLSQMKATLADWKAGKLTREIFEEIANTILGNRLNKN